MYADFFVLLGWLIKALEVTALIGIILLAYQKVSILFFGGAKNISTESDVILHSCFITALVVAVFHYIGSGVSQYILTLNLDKMEKRQLFYSTMFLMSFIGILAIFTLHKLRQCKFAPAARFTIYLGLGMCIVQMIQFYFRGIAEVDFFSPMYKLLVVTINILTLSVVSYFPVTAFLKRNCNE
jgi:fumarate reductase subunit C